jgi:hypothetical protein
LEFLGGIFGFRNLGLGLPALARHASIGLLVKAQETHLSHALFTVTPAISAILVAHLIFLVSSGIRVMGFASARIQCRLVHFPTASTTRAGAVVAEFASAACKTCVADVAQAIPAIPIAISAPLANAAVSGNRLSDNLSHDGFRIPDVDTDIDLESQIKLELDTRKREMGTICLFNQSIPQSRDTDTTNPAPMRDLLQIRLEIVFSTQFACALAEQTDPGSVRIPQDGDWQMAHGAVLLNRILDSVWIAKDTAFLAQLV